jgi:hypothetical protein
MVAKNPITLFILLCFVFGCATTSKIREIKERRAVISSIKIQVVKKDGSIDNGEELNPTIYVEGYTENGRGVGFSASFKYYKPFGFSLPPGRYRIVKIFSGYVDSFGQGNERVIIQDDIELNKYFTVPNRRDYNYVYLGRINIINDFRTGKVKIDVVDAFNSDVQSSMDVIDIWIESDLFRTKSVSDTLTNMDKLKYIKGIYY